MQFGLAAVQQNVSRRRIVPPALLPDETPVMHVLACTLL
jgi:hypothetical protein